MRKPRAITSASNLHRRERCPGSARMEAGLAEEDTAEAREGTLLHKLDCAAGTVASSMTDGLLPDEISWMLDRSARLDAEVLESVREHFGLPERASAHYRERDLVLRDGIKVVLTGTADRLVIWERERVGVVIDKKFGYLPVPPADVNRQLMAYSAMMAATHKLQYVVAAITQPRFPAAEAKTLAVYDATTLKDARATVLGILRTTATDNTLRAGIAQCRYCKAKAICPAYKAEVERMRAVAEPRGFALSEASGEQLGALLNAGNFWDLIAHDVKAEARRRLSQDPASVPGYRLGKEKMLPRVVDKEALVKGVTVDLKVPGEKLWEVAKFSVTDIRKVYRPIGKFAGKTIKDSDARVDEVLGQTGAVKWSPSEKPLERIG